MATKLKTFKKLHINETDVHPGVMAAKQLARQHHVDAGHPFRVYRNSLAFFDCAQALHTLGAPERSLLAAAALLHDLGWSVDSIPHHKASRDLILKSDLEGFTERELAMIACIARYHRKAFPKPTHRVYCDLTPDDRTTVTQLAAFLRLGDGLDRSQSAAARSVSAKRNGRRICFYIDQETPSTADIWGAQRKRTLLEKVFGLQTEIVAQQE